MYYFAYGFKKLCPPLYALQVAEQALVNAGFSVFDPVAAGKVTLGGTQVADGAMVTVVAMDCEGEPLWSSTASAQVTWQSLLPGPTPKGWPAPSIKPE